MDMMNLKTLFLHLLLSVISLHAVAQFVIRRNDTIPVFANRKQLKLPWVGGINSAHFGEIDLNLDGEMDIVVFEPNNEYNPLTGDKILPFLKKKKGGDHYYEYAPKYIHRFPKMENWMILRDFNQDGKADLFTHDFRDRVIIYRNEGDTAGPVFNLFIDVAKTMASGYPSSYIFHNEIFWNWEDYPSIEDIDNDGDLDILAIDRSGQFIEFHKNISPTLDTMIFELKNTCWGYFTEDNNIITLSVCNPNGNVGTPERKNPKGNGAIGHGQKGTKHTNTSILAIDLDGDNDKDLLMGDGTFVATGLNALYNGGSVPGAQITSVSTSFPPTNPVNLRSYSIPVYQDVDDDGVKDLLVGSRRSGFGDNVESVWFYKNNGTNSLPNFALQTKAFLQEDMIDVGTSAYPVFFDYNGDSLHDIVIGNHGYFKAYDYPRNDSVDSQLALYKNIGTKYVPEFELVTLDFAGLSTIKLDVANNQAADDIYPTFGDLDNDADEDMIVGDLYGNVHYFENTAGPNNTVAFNAPVINYQGINVGNNAAPQLIDLNRDGKLDLVIGERNGNINYYENVGTPSTPKFLLTDSTLGEVYAREEWDLWGFSKPFFYEDTLGNYLLICGTKSGFLMLYDSIEINGVLSDTFRLLDGQYQKIWNGPYSSVHGTDFNGDSAMDILVGNFSGGISLYTGDPRFIYVPGVDELNSNHNFGVEVYPNPADHYLNFEINGIASTEAIQAKIYNNVGVLVKKQVVLKQGRIDITDLAPGVYIIQLYAESRNQSTTQRFVKQ
jgi:hypothetical protein